MREAREGDWGGRRKELDGERGGGVRVPASGIKRREVAKYVGV